MNKDFIAFKISGILTYEKNCLLKMFEIAFSDQTFAAQKDCLTA